MSLKLSSRNKNKPVKQKLRDPDCRSNGRGFGVRKARVRNPALPLFGRHVQSPFEPPLAHLQMGLLIITAGVFSEE